MYNKTTLLTCKKIKAVFFKISFIKTIIISNSLDEGQEQYSDWPDLDPNCLDSFLASSICICTCACLLTLVMLHSGECF